MNRQCRCNTHEIKTQLAYGNKHIVRKADIGTSFLGSKEQFCQAFWHIRETPEADFQSTCLNGDKCSTKPAVVLLVYGDYIARYSNCADRNHAEDFIYQDRHLLDLLQPNQKMILYITLQPCHFSSKNTRKSCTLNLIEFAKQHQITIDIIFTYPYRTHWAIMSQEDHARYDQAIKNAGIGLRILQQNFKVRAMNEKDWDFLKSLSDGFEIEQEMIQERTRMDHFCQDIINRFK